MSDDKNDITITNEMPIPAKRKTPAEHAAAPLEGVGSFFAQGRALVDARRGGLARLGMLPQHVDALRMPDLQETPMLPPVLAEPLPEQLQAGDYKRRKLPELLGAEGQVEE